MTNTRPGTALVTGASSGIGALYADRLARRGYNLILVARDRERLNALANDISSRTGRTMEVLPADLNSRSDLARVEVQLRTDASITLLVNNAGMGTQLYMPEISGMPTRRLARTWRAICPTTPSRSAIRPRPDHLKERIWTNLV